MKVTGNIMPNRPPEHYAAMKANERNTQFGQPGGHNPADPNRNKPYSIVNSIRYLARQPLKKGDKSLNDFLPDNPTMAQIIAANALAKAAKGDMRAIEYVTDRIDGKVIQANINADMARLQEMSDDELHAELERLQSIASSADFDGDIAEEGSDASASDEADGLPSSDSSASV